LGQRLFELAAQLCSLQLQPLLSDHCALVGRLPVVGIHDEFDMFTLCRCHPHLIKGLVTLTLSDGNVAERAERPATRTQLQAQSIAQQQSCNMVAWDEVIGTAVIGA